MTLNSRSAKLSSPNVKVQDVPNVPTVGIPVLNTTAGHTIDVPVTPAATGGSAAIYRVVSNPGSIEGISYGSSPVSVSGLDSNTTYTFTARGETSSGATTGYTSASSSITPLFTDMEHISTINASGFTGVISFDNIPQNFKHLQLRITARAKEGGNNYEYIFMRVNGVATSTYTQHDLYANGSTITGQNLNGNNGGTGGYVTGSSSDTNNFGASIIDLPDYTSTTKDKSWRTMSGRAGNSNLIMFSGSALNTTSAVSSITFYIIYGTNWAVGSRFSLYGIRG